MTDPYRQLQDALDALERVFAPTVSRPFTVRGCGHCHSPADLEVLAGPVSRIPDALVGSVASEATDHWDDFPGLYRRMTPRIVRLMVAGRLHADHGQVASWLLAAGWRAWAEPEREALEGVWHAWWWSVLHEYPSHGFAANVLEVISVSTGTLTPWLEAWARAAGPEADFHLSDALDSWLYGDELADLRFGFRGELHATPELLPWLLSLKEGRIGAAQLRRIEDIALR